MMYEARVIGSLRQLASMAGRALALLAVMLVALMPALPAHAHLERGQAVAIHGHAQGVAHHTHDHAAALEDRHDASDRDAPASLPQHSADCCFVCHAPVVPNVAAVPMPRTVIRAALRPADRTVRPDALAERQPEPPRPSA